MNRDAFTAFVRDFGQLNPYELDYFCRKWCETYQTIAAAGSVSIQPLDQAFVTLALTQTMRLLKIEITQEKIKAAENELAAAKQQTFSDLQEECLSARLQELAEQTRRLNETD